MIDAYTHHAESGGAGGTYSTTGAGAIVKRNTEVGPGETWVGVPARSLGRRQEQRPQGGGGA